MRTLKVTLLLFLSSLPIVSYGEMAKPQERQLLNECRPMSMVIEGLSEHANAIGLTEKMLTDMVESRLRSSRLYEDRSAYNADPYLYLGVNVGPMAFGAAAQFRRMLFEEGNEIVAYGYFATTWDHGLIGTHGQDADHIIESVRKLVDIFILEYLRANEEYCD